jgi:hypothetical protein
MGGGAIPFMHMLGENFPEAQFFISGIRARRCLSAANRRAAGVMRASIHKHSPVRE